ncbi:hypothetical protein VOLCADRAFT_110035 [Volvox carteri f. nagariensis]|uniref:Thiamine pyrimidine synthase n=1 Tax=Volvox carteri f. nagariensis TaxID=3068 RepID=D8UE51_VOLCA|nr:uncharacterized protein VOLCADRAFT_110035 [Volvox carteri f. nagariensis]EFJ42027.1 hypothetical protein VOLCADRAFT_110035 [Volvox carteri f. nagariensis]|eukprot:XP_002956902.1 hypothetical protein VOLCADRAFT_110035 [Volvox carteri f. nagariensis]
MTIPVTVSVALDWTPNTNHAGFYIAKHKGWYAEAGLDIKVVSPHIDDYKATPASRVADGSCMFCVTPSESVISAHTWGDAPGAKPKLVAVAALLQDSTSAIVTLASSGITRPAQLDGKTYASYGARFEGRIVQQLIRNDGGAGDFKEITPPMLGIWETLLKGEADATWVFMGWEAIEAKQRGVEIHAFGLEQYKVPYGYSPLLVTHPDTIRDRPEVVRAFLAATARAYEWAAANPGEAAEVMLAAVAEEHSTSPLPKPLDPELVRESQAYLSSHLLDGSGRWGLMSPAVWSSFVDWLSESGLLTTKVQSRNPQAETATTLDGLRAGDVGERIPRDVVDVAAMFTNDLLPPPTATATATATKAAEAEAEAEAAV